MKFFDFLIIFVTLLLTSCDIGKSGVVESEKHNNIDSIIVSKGDFSFDKLEEYLAEGGLDSNRYMSLRLIKARYDQVIERDSVDFKDFVGYFTVFGTTRKFILIKSDLDSLSKVDIVSDYREDEDYKGQLDIFYLKPGSVTGIDSVRLLSSGCSNPAVRNGNNDTLLFGNAEKYWLDFTHFYLW